MIRQSQKIVVAADASGRVTFAPDSASAVWRLDACGLLPNEASVANDTNYATITPKRGSTELATGRSTTVVGGGLAQGVAETFTLTSNLAYREITQANPLHVLVDATPGTGVAVDVSVFASFTELRA